MSEFPLRFDNTLGAVSIGVSPFLNASLTLVSLCTSTGQTLISMYACHARTRAAY